jgi:hypothetical protein
VIEQKEEFLVDQEMKDKIVGCFSIKVKMADGKEISLPSPARFLELQDIKNPEDIVEITRNILAGNKQLAREIVSKHKSKKDEIEFIVETYSEVIFQFVMLSVHYKE